MGIEAGAASGTASKSHPSTVHADALGPSNPGQGRNMATSAMASA